MAQRESKLSRDIMKELMKQPDVFCFKVHGSEFMMAGLPDIIGVVDGQFFGFETKRPGKESTTKPIQHHIMGMIGKAGGYTAVVTSVDEAMRHLKHARAKRNS